MNNQEAIARLQVGMHIKKEEIKNNKVFFPKHDNSRLEEDIEVYEIAISAIDKQIPKKPIRNSSGDLACLCGLIIQMKSKRKCLYFCHNCGQAIKWGDDD